MDRATQHKAQEADLIRGIQADKDNPVYRWVLKLLEIQEEQAVLALVSCSPLDFPAAQGKAQALRQLRNRLTSPVMEITNGNRT